MERLKLRHFNNLSEYTKQFIDNDGDDDEYQVSFEYRGIEDFNVTQKLCFVKKEHQSDVFNKVDQETVNKMFDGVGNNLCNSKASDDE